LFWWSLKLSILENDFFLAVVTWWFSVGVNVRWAFFCGGGCKVGIECKVGKDFEDTTRIKGYFEW
jgi:hypothetical protein